MSGHVETVTVSQCGWWIEGRCDGDETGCSYCTSTDGEGSLLAGPFETLAARDADTAGLEGEELEGWLEKPHPTKLTHGEFLRQYDRCPDGCEVAQQLDMTGALA